LIGSSRLRQERRVPLQDVLDAVGVLLRLLERIRRVLLASVNEQRDAEPVDRSDRVGLPVLDLEDQQTAAGIEDQKVR
jgi:hypothetical protein